MKRIGLLFLLICFFTVAQGQVLDDYLRTAAENNPGIKARYAEFEAAMQRIPQARALPDPTLSIGVFISPIETRVGPQRSKFSLSQMFPWFGTLAAKEDVAALIADAKYQEFLDSKNELFFKVKAAYYPLYEVREQIKWQQENLEILNTYKTLAIAAFSNAKGTMVDVIRVDIMIDNTETDIQLLKDQLRPLEIVFNRLLNRTDSLPVSVTDSLFTVSIEDTYRRDSLLADNPMLQAIDFKIKSAFANAEVAKKEGLPKFGIGTDYAIVGERTDMSLKDNGKNAFMPMVTMSLPIFRGKYKASIKEAQLNQIALTSKKADIENNLVSSYEMTWYELEKARQLNDLYNEQITKTRQAIDLLYAAYSNSGNEFDEVLRMQQQLLKYEMAKATAIKDFYIALARMDYLTAKSN